LGTYTLGEHIGNLGNILGTHWELGGGGPWAKHMGLRLVAIGNLHPWGTHWELMQHIWNPLGT